MTFLVAPAMPVTVQAFYTEPARWLPADTDALVRRVVQTAIADQHVWEVPLGSNRGPEVDRWLRWAGLSEAQLAAGAGYWCQAWAANVWHRAGAEVVRTASCDVALAWARESGRFSEHVPSLGAMVFYGKWNPVALKAGRRELLSKTDAVHVGIVVRFDYAAHRIGTQEGNTTAEGSKLERNGTAVAGKLVTAEDPVIGYGHLRSLSR